MEIFTSTETIVGGEGGRLYGGGAVVYPNRLSSTWQPIWVYLRMWQFVNWINSSSAILSAWDLDNSKS